MSSAAVHETPWYKKINLRQSGLIFALLGIVVLFQILSLIHI